VETAGRRHGRGAPAPADGSPAAPVPLRPVVHVGYHKTGTTWLQRTLFADPASGFASPLSKGTDIPRELIEPSALEFDADACRAALRPPLEAAREAGLVPVLSSERLAGAPHSGGYDSKELADRIRAVFPDARVLIAIREQRSMVLSTYKQYVRAGGPCPLGDYLDPPERGRPRVPAFSFAHFEYHRLIAHYRDLFGAGDVLVLPYELLASRPRELVERLLGFCELDPGAQTLERLPYAERSNEGLSGVGVAFKRRLNPLLSRDRLNPRPLVRLPDADRRLVRWTAAVDARAPERLKARVDAALRERVAARVGDRYRESNARTRELTGLDLEHLDYDV